MYVCMYIILRFFWQNKKLELKIEYHHRHHHRNRRHLRKHAKITEIFRDRRFGVILTPLSRENKFMNANI